MKKRVASLLLILSFLVSMLVPPASAAEYTLMEGDVIYVPGAATAGEKAEAYMIRSATVASGTKVEVTITAGTSDANGTTHAGGAKSNKSADRFWVMTGGKLKKAVGVWEDLKTAQIYKFGYHDYVTEATDTTLTLSNNSGHKGGNACTYNFNNSCGDTSQSNRYRECAARLTVGKDLVIVDLRADVVLGKEQPAATAAQIKALCDKQDAVVNTYVPDGTKDGGTAAVLLVLDYVPKLAVESIDVPAGTVSALSKEGCNVNTFNGGGTLHINSSARMNVVGTVNGNTTITFEGIPQEAVYVTAPSATPDDAFRYQGVGKLTVTDDGTTKSWAITDLPDVGLKLTAPEGVTLKLYTGFPVADFKNSGDLIPATHTTTENGIVTNYYKQLSSGTYHYKAEGEGYYSASQPFRYTPEQSTTGAEVQVKADRVGTDGFEAPFVVHYSEDFLKNASPSAADTWGKEYEHIFTTPYFLRDKSVDHKHQQTTQDEMMAFIRKLDETGGNMYVYSLGKSPKYGYDVPVVVFTKENLTGKTLEQAAEIIRGNGKPTIHYQAQIHSKEPGAGEGALAVMQDMAGTYGDKVLDTIDLYIIPRVNSDGAREFIRYSATTGKDMNDDYLAQTHDEVRMVTNAYNLFLPEVMLDGHEMKTPKSGQVAHEDVTVQAIGGARQHPVAMSDMVLDMMKYTLGNAQKLGLRTGAYSGTALSSAPVAGNEYCGMRNTLAFLIETRGIDTGMNIMERRVFSQYITVTGLIDYTVNNAKSVMETVHASRDYMVRTGATYEEDDVFVLEHKKTDLLQWTNPSVDMLTGESVNPDRKSTWTGATDIGRSRPRPTAYVLPKSLPKIAEILALMDQHAIRYYELPADTTVQLKQYIMNGDTATLTPEQAVLFAQGACVFTLDQVSTTVLSIMMEPDFLKSSEPRTLEDMGLVEKDANGYLPIYRYCHDLVDGKITVEETCKGGEGCPAAKFADVDASAWYHAAVDSVLTNGIMSGYNDTTFGTNDSLTRAMVVQVLYNRMGKPEVKAENKFSDVAEGSWYYDAVRWAADKGIVSGYGDGKFGAEDAVTLEQAAVILHNYSGKPAAESDLSAVGTYSDWAADALHWCGANGLLKNIPFEKAVDTANRAQTAQLLTNYLNP